jgi:hypothetical protein
MRWFRMYAEAIDDPKLRLLAFEDRWHYVAVLCMKAEGMLDEHRSSPNFGRMVAAKLGLAARDADEVRRRLVEVEIIDENWQPTGWDRRQYASDTSADRTRKWREKNQQDIAVKRHSDVTVTPPDTDTDTDSSSSKKKARKRAFVRPSVEEVAGYCRKRGNSIDPEEFVDHYTANGWKRGKTPIQDWEAAVRTWEKRANEKPDRTARGTVFEQPHERRARELREFAERAEGGESLEKAPRNVRGQVLEGVWSRSE